MKNKLMFTESSVVEQFGQHIRHVMNFDNTSVRIIVDSGVLAVYSLCMQPQAFSSHVPTIVGMYACPLDIRTELCDIVVPTQSLLHRSESAVFDLKEQAICVTLPAPVSTFTWNQFDPPHKRWFFIAHMRAEGVKLLANQANMLLQQYFLEAKNKQDRLRARETVWSVQLHSWHLLPWGAACALETLGFLSEKDPIVEIYGTRVWTRATTRSGHVLVKNNF